MDQNPFLAFLSAYAPNLLMPFMNFMQNLQQSPGGMLPAQLGPVQGAPGGLNYGGGQTAAPWGFQQGPVSAPGQTPYSYLPFGSQPPIQTGPYNNRTNILFRPVIVQTQINSLPLRNIGGINATMNANASLGVNGVNPYGLRVV